MAKFYGGNGAKVTDSRESTNFPLTKRPGGMGNQSANALQTNTPGKGTGNNAQWQDRGKGFAHTTPTHQGRYAPMTASAPNHPSFGSKVGKSKPSCNASNSERSRAIHSTGKPHNPEAFSKGIG